MTVPPSHASTMVNALTEYIATLANVPKDLLDKTVKLVSFKQTLEILTRTGYAGNGNKM